jgi:hypothetical protein
MRELHRDADVIECSNKREWAYRCGTCQAHVVVTRRGFAGIGEFTPSPPTHACIPSLVWRALESARNRRSPRRVWKQIFNCVRAADFSAIANTQVV